MDAGSEQQTGQPSSGDSESSCSMPAAGLLGPLPRRCASLRIRPLRTEAPGCPLSELGAAVCEETRSSTNKDLRTDRVLFADVGGDRHEGAYTMSIKRLLLRLRLRLRPRSVAFESPESTSWERYRDVALMVHYIALHCTTLHYSALHRTISHYMQPYIHAQYPLLPNMTARGGPGAFSRRQGSFPPSVFHLPSCLQSCCTEVGARSPPPRAGAQTRRCLLLDAHRQSDALCFA